MWNGLVPHSCVAVENSEDILAVTVSLDSSRVLVSHWDSQPRIPVLGREISTTSDDENQQR